MNRGMIAFWRILLTLIATISACTSITVNAQTKAAKQLPVEAFAQLDFLDKARLSPNGQYLAAMMAVAGEQKITILPLIAGSSEKMVRLGVPDDMQVNWIRWVSDDYIIAGVTALVTFGDANSEAYVSRLISISRTSGDVKRLMWHMKGQDAADLIWSPADGSNEIMMSAQGSIYSNLREFWPTVFRVNVANGNFSREKRGIQNVTSWGADAAGNLRFGIRRSDISGTQQVLYRSVGMTGFKTIQRSNMREFESLELPFIFVPDTDNGLFINSDENGKKVIKEINLITQEDVATRFEMPSADITGVVLSYDRKSILGVYTSDKNQPLHWLDEKRAAAQKFLDGAVKGAKPRIVSSDRNGDRLLVWISSSQNPGLYYIYDTPTQQLSKLAEVNKDIGSRRLAKPKYVQYKARDGLEIEGVLTLPKGREAKNLPLIMMPHGGPWAHDRVSYDYWAQFLANRGYAVMQPNFRGSTGYGKAFEQKGHGQMGLAMQDDVTDGIKYLADEGIIDPQRVCIVGASYGGYYAMWGIAKDPDLYRCAISIAGVANVRRDVNAFGGSLLARTFSAQWGKMSDDFKAISPVNSVDNIKVPLLLIHGKKDERVDYKQSLTMQKAMSKAGKDVDMLILPKADHYFLRQEDRIALLSSMEEFLIRHNPPD